MYYFDVYFLVYIIDIKIIIEVYSIQVIEF